MATAIPRTENWLNCSRNDYFADISDRWYSLLCLPSLVRSRTVGTVPPSIIYSVQLIIP